MFHKDSVPYRIETARTVIRCWHPNDAPILQNAINASVESLLPWMPWAKGEPKEYHSKIDTLRTFRGNFDLGNDFVLGIFDSEETEVLGGCGLHTRAGKYSLEIGYWINKTHQQKGYATEITRALIIAGFELSDIDNIQIYCDVKNVASLQVIEKTGFQKEGVLIHKQKNADGDFQDLQSAVFLRDSYSQSNFRSDKISIQNAIGEKIL